MPEHRSREPLVWIDCEMTGLDVETDSILQIACFVTDHDLEIQGEGFETVIHHDIDRLQMMSQWCQVHHAKSGLTAKAVKSTVTHEEAANALLSYIRRYVPEPKKALLAGNTVHMDRAFLQKPPYDKVLHHLGYRILDVSSIKEAAKRWASPEKLAKTPHKKGTHEATADILESIAEAKFYRDNFFRG